MQLRDSINGRINNLFFGALSWLLLHEIAHVHRGDSVWILPAALRIGQEYRADAFATGWVLNEAGHGLQREFRVRDLRGVPGGAGVRPEFFSCRDLPVRARTCARLRLSRRRT